MHYLKKENAMKEKKNAIFGKLWWIGKISIFIVLGDALLFRTLDIALVQAHDLENMSAIAAVFLGLKFFVVFFSFWYVVIMAGVGLVCMDQSEGEFVKRLFPIKNRIIKWFYVPELIYVIFLIMFLYDKLWIGILAMFCYTAANYLSAVWFTNAYNAYQPRIYD